VHVATTCGSLHALCLDICHCFDWLSQIVYVVASEVIIRQGSPRIVGVSVVLPT